MPNKLTAFYERLKAAPGLPTKTVTTTSFDYEMLSEQLSDGERHNFKTNVDEIVHFRRWLLHRHQWRLSYKIIAAGFYGLSIHPITQTTP